MPSEEFEDNYRIKWITERSTGKKYAVLLQNRNGPCPLLAISNALLLRGNIDIHEDMSHVNEEMLIEKITEYIFRANPLLREGEEEVVANEQQNLADVITTLPKLKKGIDVNVRFNAPDAFEFTPELSCFDMCRVRLLHGWLVDPQDPYSFDSFAKLTYNQLVDLIITASSSDQYGHLENGMDSEECSNRQVIAKLAGDFLEDNPSQLTLHGFHALSSAVAENEICVFFRNNHFSTLTRRDGKLFLLVSDLGYLHEPEIVWDKFIGIHGESQFFNFDLVVSIYQNNFDNLVQGLNALLDDRLMIHSEEWIGKTKTWRNVCKRKRTGRF
uniref:MINDY deubiquitinase domain-containing protein n=2 Tax=Rhodosorus marinus TaxID=101924 RepID=A0A7S3E8W5_9RHOD|mmetsp:Transcript_17271/g.70125  ORF Transcript_17271/g.70125 Transcript_17271/m.70125 type:complete len:328 (+) Transcript_17271:78-1061(+)